MKTLQEREQREYERQEIIRKAVEAADCIILDGSDGSVEETDWLTSEVAKKFVEKVNIAMSTKLVRKDLEQETEEYFAIFSPLIDKVIGTCTDQGRLDVEVEEPHCKFVPLTKQQFETYGDKPEQWTQLDEISVEKPK